MKLHRVFGRPSLVLSVLTVCFVCPYGRAQAFSLTGATPSIEVLPPINGAMAETPRIHKFWDKTNTALFAATTALSAADFAVTRANLRSGGTELNPMVRVFGRSAPGLAANFAGQAVSAVALSYMFHKTGHHRLERMTSMINLSTSSIAVTYGLCHR